MTHLLFWWNIGFTFLGAPVSSSVPSLNRLSKVHSCECYQSSALVHFKLWSKRIRLDEFLDSQLRIIRVVDFPWPPSRLIWVGYAFEINTTWSAGFLKFVWFVSFACFTGFRCPVMSFQLAIIHAKRGRGSLGVSVRANSDTRAAWTRRSHHSMYISGSVVFGLHRQVNAGMLWTEIYGSWLLHAWFIFRNPQTVRILYVSV